MTMKLKGEDVATGVREAFKDELKKGPSKRHELGKHFFAVSTGTLGLFSALLKFSVSNPSFDFMTVCCFFLLLASVFIALYMSLPIVVEVRDGLDVYEKYNEIMKGVFNLSVVWVLVWVAGFLFGIVKLF